MIYSVNPSTTALLVIDVQKEYFKQDGPAFIPHAKDVLPNIQRLIKASRKAQMLVVYVKHANREDGSDAGRMGDFSSPDDPSSFVAGSDEVELIDELNPRNGEPIIEKRRYSCFLNTELEAILRTKGIDTIAISGYMTSFCCETTARDGHGRDYRVLFVKDAVEGPDLQDADGNPVPHDAVLAHTITALSAGFAEAITTKEFESRALRKGA